MASAIVAWWRIYVALLIETGWHINVSKQLVITGQGSNLSHSTPSYHFTLTHCGVENLVNIGLGNGSLPDGTNPLPEPILTYQQLSLMTFI